MLPASDDGSAARNAFLRLFLADVQAGVPRALSDYQVLFPAHAATVAREYGLLVEPADAEPAVSTAAGRARELQEDPLFAATAGQRFGSYVLIRPLGRGGQGVVWLARDLRLERLVALKLLTHLAALSHEALARFRREAQVASRLSDPGICTVFESGSEGGVPYIAMRYVEGETLAEKLARARDEKRKGGVARLDLPVRAGDHPGDGLARLAQLTEHIARSLHLAHEAGVVHRDLKPGNIMVDREGLPVLLDFGLAGVLDESSPTLTRTGDIFGTPAYMAPEQITQSAGGVDRRADVYALGASLYECLTLQPPFDSVTRAALFQAICHESPSDPRRIDPRIPADLKTILETCLAKDRDRRYQSALDLAEDLRRWRTGEPILAHPPSQTYRLRMLVRRHRTAAVSVFVLVLVLAVATALTTAGMLRARTKAAEVLRLSTLQDLDDLARRADELWPVDPERIPALESWLAEARDLLADLPEHERTIAELRARALPQTEAEHAAQRAGHPLRPQLDSARDELAFLQRQEAGWKASLAGEPPLEPTAEEVGVDWDALPADPDALGLLSWMLVFPERQYWGGERRALVLIRRALEGYGDPPRSSPLDTLAWALFANGRFAEGVAAVETALAVAGEKVPERQRGLAKFRLAVEDFTSLAGCARRAEKMVALGHTVAELEKTIEERWAWTFEDVRDRWWHVQIETLIRSLADLGGPAGLLSGISPEHGWGVERRLEWATSIRERSLAGASAARLWAEAIGSIRDEASAPHYGGLELVPQLGILPIGRDPSSGLWEFAHLQSGAPATRGPDGRLLLEEDTGIVLVLIPGATFWMGAQSSDPAVPNHDASARDDEGPVLAVTLEPYFLSKYEMTQGQWLRTVGANPSIDEPLGYATAHNADGAPGDLLHPVEYVDWTSCARVLGWLDLALPTEAQWEHAARGGTRTPWWTGADETSLAGAANLSDRYSSANGREELEAETWLDDGNTSHARVGSYRANPFGLHDVVGNVAELCREKVKGYDRTRRSGDGETLEWEVDLLSARSLQVDETPEYRNRVVRGGHMGDTAERARSSSRADALPEYRSVTLGVRPARPIRR